MNNPEAQREIRDRQGETRIFSGTLEDTAWIDVIPASAVSGVLTEVAIQTSSTGENQVMHVELNSGDPPWSVFGSFAWSLKGDKDNFKIRTDHPPLPWEVVVNREPLYA